MKPHSKKGKPAANMRTYETWSKLLKDRAIHIDSPINDAIANTAIAKLLFLQMEDRRAPILLLIDSPGGRVAASLAISDTLNVIQPPVHTICTGQAAGIAALIVAQGRKGARACLWNSRFQVIPVGTETKTDDPKTEIELAKLNERILAAFCDATGQKHDRMRTVIAQSRTFDANEAKEFGFVDLVVETLDELKPAR